MGKGKFIAVMLMVVFPSTVFAMSSSAPVRIDQTEIESSIGASAYFVVDRASGEVLTMKQEDRVWPIASLTKLVTADVVLDQKISTQKLIAMKNSDNVGGARLTVNEGGTFSVGDLFYAALVASANNAANALARATGLSKELFVQEMNSRAYALGLTRTLFVDPTGIETANVSTAREMSVLARDIFSRPEIKTYTTTAIRFIRVTNEGTKKKMINTNWMLWKPQYEDVWVTGGKTGYLDEAGWNAVVALKPKKNDERELVIVVFGAKSRNASFTDVERLAKWAWDVYRWTI